MLSFLLDATLSIARSAGDILLRYFRSGALAVRNKEDSSPVTEADEAASAFLVQALEALSGDPVLSEERLVPFEARRDRRIWIVDPLDGTRDFLAGDADFAVNVALVEEGRPVLGVIHAPARGESWFGESGGGAFVERAGRRERLPRIHMPGLIGVGSRFHDSPRARRFRKANPLTGVIVAGASLKFAFIAEGIAHVYATLGGAGEWDTAAGQVLLEESGGALLTVAEGAPVRYNRPDPRVPPCAALGRGLRFADLAFPS